MIAATDRKERNDLSLQSRTSPAAPKPRHAAQDGAELEAPADLLGVAERKTAEIDHAIAKREATAVRARLLALERAARARIALLESKRNEAEAFVTRTQTAIQLMNVVATRDGTIVYTANRNGEKRKEGDSVWKAERVIEPTSRDESRGGSGKRVDAARQVGQLVRCARRGSG